MTGRTELPERILYDFCQGGLLARFRPINDGVMGGSSSGELVAAQNGEGALFRGVVSFENNGGFASVRSLPEDHRLAGYSGVTLRVRGDGKRYKVTLKTSPTSDGVQYQARIHPPVGEWVDLLIPFSAFIPTFRGRVRNDVSAIDPAKIVTVGLMISDEQEGPFSLAIMRLGARR